MKQIHALAFLVIASLLSAVAGSTVIAGEPIFAGIWSQKEQGGVGGLFYDLTWDELIAKWKELGDRQYLADVEVYETDDGPRFSAVWRVGSGNGALYLHDWPHFSQTWVKLKSTQDLIDIETFATNQGRRYLGVWREKPPGREGDGGLLAGLSWSALTDKRKALGSVAYLADVETYIQNGKRKYIGVWRVGQGNGALYQMNEWGKFAATKQRLNSSQEMLDFEMFQATDGKWNFLGVWRVSNRAGPLYASTSNNEFVPLTAAQLVNLWQQHRSKATLIGLTVAVPTTPKLTSLRADTTCKYGDADCNRCATDVAKQFKWAFETGHRPWLGWQEGSWDFRGDDRYPPDDRQPESAFYPYEDALVKKHVQGFVRTNSSRFPYAGSHSHKNSGSIFFVERRNGKNVLQSLYNSAEAHPSGVAVLGDGLFVAESDRLRWFRISASGSRQNNSYRIPKVNSGESGKDGLRSGGGGLGLAKLEDGTSLLVVTAPGDGFRKGTTKKQRAQNTRPRHTRFYRLVPNAFTPQKEGIAFLGDWRHEGLTSKPKKPMAYSENLSVISECNSGKIYTIHTTGDYKLKGDGYWRLSRVDFDSKGPRLVQLGIARQSQDNEKCHHRSSATVHVNQDGKLEFLCSERAVIKWHPSGTFNFKEGKP